jgi:WD40 repeat protein
MALTPHHDTITALSWSRTGLLASGARDRTVKLWRCADGALTELMTLPFPSPVRWLCFHPDGVRLFVLLNGEKAVRVWHLDRLGSKMAELGLADGLEKLEAQALPPATAATPVVPVLVPPDGPNGLRTELFTDLELRRCVKVRYDRDLNVDWGTGSPDPLVPADNFSVRWTGWLKAPQPGRYFFQLKGDDTARMWLDGKLVLDSVSNPCTLPINLSDRPHALRIEHKDVWGNASIQLKWGKTETGLAPVPAEVLFHDRATAEKTALKP